MISDDNCDNKDSTEENKEKSNNLYVSKFKSLEDAVEKIIEPMFKRWDDSNEYEWVKDIGIKEDDNKADDESYDNDIYIEFKKLDGGTRTRIISSDKGLLEDTIVTKDGVLSYTSPFNKKNKDVFEDGKNECTISTLEEAIEKMISTATSNNGES